MMTPNRKQQAESSPNQSSQPPGFDGRDAVAVNGAWRDSGVPARHRCRVDQWVAGGEKPSGSEWLKTRGKIIGRLDTGATVALIGPRGTGKTQLAACAVHAVCMGVKAGQWIGELKIARYTTAINIFRAVNATFGSRDDTEASVIHGYTKPRLLVIDECHVRRGTESEGVVLTDLIDQRYGDRTDTILISNQTEPEFIKSIGSSVHDRLIETGGLIVCDWESYRQQG